MGGASISAGRSCQAAGHAVPPSRVRVGEPAAVSCAPTGR